MPPKLNKVILVRGIRRRGKNSVFYHITRRLEPERIVS